MGIKIIFVGLVLMVSVLVKAQTSKLNLTPNQENAILENLNNICGDAWCEGEYELVFKSVKHVNRQGTDIYEIEFVASNSYEDDATKISLICEVSDIQMIQEFVNKNGLRSMTFLEEKLYRTIDDCLLKKLYSKK